jgi:hypothetical protein
MFEREVAGFRRDRSLAEGAHSVRGDDDVEPLGQRREQRRDVCLSSTDLGECDHQDDPRTPRA